MRHRVTKTGERQRGDLVGRRRRSGNGSGDGSALTENGEGAASGRAEGGGCGANRVAWGTRDWGTERAVGRGGRICPSPGTGRAPCLLFPSGPGRAARRAHPAAQARPGLPGRAGTGTKPDGPCRAWAGPKNRASCRAVGLRAACSSIPITQGPRRRVPSRTACKPSTHLLPSLSASKPWPRCPFPKPANSTAIATQRRWTHRGSRTTVDDELLESGVKYASTGVTQRSHVPGPMASESNSYAGKNTA